MNDPDTSLPPLPDDIARLLAAEKVSPGAPRGAQAALLARVLSTSSAAPIAGRLAIAFAAGAVVGASTLAVIRPTLEPQIVIQRVEVPVEVVRTATVFLERSSATRTVVLPSPSRADPRAASQRETLLLERARAALARGLPLEAQAALLEHAKTFAHGAQTEEREALLVLTLLALGRSDEADASAKRFHRNYPQSLFGAMIDAERRSGIQ